MGLGLGGADGQALLHQLHRPLHLPQPGGGGLKLVNFSHLKFYCYCKKNKQELSLTSVFLVNIVSTWFQEIVTHALTLEEPTAPVQHGGEVGGDEVSEGYRGLCQGEQETVHARRSVS